MKRLLFLLLVIVLTSVNLFSQTATLRAPECIVYDEVKGVYYVSNVGQFNKPDGKISVLSRAYELKDFINWGLDDPKGMVILGRKLYVADITKIVIIDIEEETISETINVSGSEFLNGMCSDGERYIYITEMFQNKIFRLDTRNNQVTALQLKGSVLTPNGILYEKAKNRLLVVSFKEEAPIYEISLSDLTTKVILYTPLNFLDGIVMDRIGNFYLTAWENQNINGGKLYRYDYNFEQPEFLLATGLSGPASLYFNQLIDSLLVPNMLTNNISYFYYPAKPENVTKLYPPDKSTDINTKVEFKWLRAKGSLNYTLQIAEDSDFSNIMIEHKINFPEILSISIDLQPDKKYYWRIRGTNSKFDGDWGDAWSFTTKSTIDYKPKLIEPKNGAKNIGLKPEFKWNMLTVQYYELLVYDNEELTGEPIINATGIQDTTFTPENELNRSSTYCWKVRGIKDTPREWSDVWCFKTLGDKPQKPKLQQPPDGADNIDINYTFIWENQEDAELYILYLSTNPDLSDAEIYEIEYDNSITIMHLNYNTKYYWQVVAINESGESEPSDIWSFTTVQAGSVYEYNSDKIAIYPNPASDYFVIQINDFQSINSSISLLNSIGMKIREIEIKTGFGVIDTADLSSGIYYLRITKGTEFYIKAINIIK